MQGPPLGPGGEDITWLNQVAPRGRKASSTRKIKPEISNSKRSATASPSVSLPTCLRSRVVSFSVLTSVNLPGKLVV